MNGEKVIFYKTTPVWLGRLFITYYCFRQSKGNFSYKVKHMTIRPFFIIYYI